MRSERANILVKVATSKFFDGRANGIKTTPHQNEKEKTRSVGVQPFQSACSNGGYMADQSPGLTMVIIKTVSPLNTSNEIKRSFTIAFRLIIIKSTYYFF
jgi:hypothetical protein